MFPRENRKQIFAIYFASFFFTLALALPLYTNSSFLDQFVSERSIGFIYSVGSLLSLVSLAFYPALLSAWGNQKTALLVFIFQSLFLFGLAFPFFPFLIPIIFILLQVSYTLFLFNIDVFLETFTKEAAAGRIRGLMLTILSLAILLGPLIAGVLLVANGYEKIYLYSASISIPVGLIFLFRFKKYRDPLYDRTPIFLKIKRVFLAEHPDDRIRHVFGASFLMQFFYSWMVIYTPIYLHQYIGFSWGEVGIILPLMLLAFIFLEYPIGRFLDRNPQEPLVITVGFVIAALFTMSLFFPSAPSLILWAALLFGTRVGISLVEIGSESYFFRHIKPSETNIISIFRDAYPIAWLIGPLTASLILSVATVQYLFPILALIMLYGAWVGVRLKK